MGALISRDVSTGPIMGSFMQSASRVISLTQQVRQCRMHRCLLEPASLYQSKHWLCALCLYVLFLCPHPMRSHLNMVHPPGRGSLFGVCQSDSCHWGTSGLIPSDVSHQGWNFLGSIGACVLMEESAHIFCAQCLYVAQCDHQQFCKFIHHSPWSHVDVFHGGHKVWTSQHQR